MLLKFVVCGFVWLAVEKISFESFMKFSNYVRVSTRRKRFAFCDQKHPSNWTNSFAIFLRLRRVNDFKESRKKTSLNEKLRERELQLNDQLFNQMTTTTMQFSYQSALVSTTHRQTPKSSCAGVRRGTALDRALTSLCGTRCPWCCRSDTSVGRNLFHMPARFLASSSSTLECSFDMIPVKRDGND